MFVTEVDTTTPIENLNRGMKWVVKARKDTWSTKAFEEINRTIEEEKAREERINEVEDEKDHEENHVMILLSTLLNLNKNSQITIHPIHSSGRKQCNSPFTIRIHQSQSIWNKDFDLPRSRLGKQSRQLVAEATGEDLFQTSKVGTLLGWKVDAGDGALSVLEDIDAENGALRSGGQRVRVQVRARHGGTLLGVGGRVSAMFGREVVTDNTRDITSNTAGTVWC